MSIFFWVREACGWILVVISMFMLWQGLVFLTNIEQPRIIESSIINIAALGVLRAGILLIRISTTSRVALQLTKPARIE